jgi:histidine triad (HIT) family protein
MKCLFCSIADKSIPADIVFENEDIIAFNDINPQAPHHILVIPKKHIENILEFSENDDKLLVKITRAIQTIAKKTQMDSQGLRVVINTGKNAGQTVYHVHFHLLGGRSMQWPPG